MAVSWFDYSELIIGNNKYFVEKLDENELIISEKGDPNTHDDKKNRYYFIESKNLINYLSEKSIVSSKLSIFK